jgi:murein DD-endopeptidase MepM/ murein hydrolase activator NlpD
VLNKHKIDFNRMKDIRKVSILVVPEESGMKAKSRKFSIQQIAAIIVSYSLFVFIISYFLLAFTPIGDLLNFSGNPLSKEDMQEVKTLNERMIFLAKEVEQMKSTNEKLRYAIFLGDSAALDSLTRPDSVKNNSDQTIRLKNKKGGDIFSVFRDLFLTSDEYQGKEVFFSKPVNGFISREFDPDRGHFGIDYVVKTGTPVYAACSGYVVFADYTVRDGYMLIINSPSDYVTVYKHCSSLLKKTRDIVTEGELIALSGNTGEITTGPHLHFEVWKNGKPVNPKTLFINY